MAHDEIDADVCYARRMARDGAPLKTQFAIKLALRFANYSVYTLTLVVPRHCCLFIATAHGDYGAKATVPSPVYWQPRHATRADAAVHFSAPLARAWEQPRVCIDGQKARGP
jgi:hypothetical protein